ncbi:MAG: HPP family protein [Clostridia bacterium]|nr:HPP family protein [Clostridia bacterium]
MSKAGSEAEKLKEETPHFTWEGYFKKIKCKPRDFPLPGLCGFDLFVSWLGAFLGISTVAFLTLYFDVPLLVASFGASAVLIYGVPEAPLSQPRNVILGHTIAATTGVVIYSIFGLTWWSAALGCSLGILIMLITKTTHPPAGATALIGVWNQQAPMFIFAPVFVGAVILVIIGLITNNISPRRSYPKYWI